MDMDQKEYSRTTSVEESLTRVPSMWRRTSYTAPGTPGTVVQADVEMPLDVYNSEEWTQTFKRPQKHNKLFSDEFIRKIPKCDLHVHLDGSIRLSTLLDLARQYNIELPGETEKELRKTVFKEAYANLGEYLKGFAYTVAVMRTAAALTRIAYEVAVDNFTEGVRYFECRFAPQLHCDANCSEEAGVKDIRSVLLAVDIGLKKAAEEFNKHEEVVKGLEPSYGYGIIVCAMRTFNEQFSPYYCSLCYLHQFEDMKRVVSLASMALCTAALTVRNEDDVPIVALDIAGEEYGHPASYHLDAYNLAQKNFLRKTVHAGEGFGPQSIFQALTDLHAERIGHGFHIFNWRKAMEQSGREKLDEDDAKEYVNRLVQYVADRRITLEVCLTSNLQTMPELKGDLQNHSLKTMLEQKISVTLGTDNRTVSNTTVCKEYRLAVDFFQLTPAQLKDIVVAGFKRSFYPGEYRVKRAYNRRIIDYYEELEKKYVKS